MKLEKDTTGARARRHLRPKQPAESGDGPSNATEYLRLGEGHRSTLAEPALVFVESPSARVIRGKGPGKTTLFRDAKPKKPDSRFFARYEARGTPTALLRSNSGSVGRNQCELRRATTVSWRIERAQLRVSFEFLLRSDEARVNSATPTSTDASFAPLEPRAPPPIRASMAAHSDEQTSDQAQGESATAHVRKTQYRCHFHASSCDGIGSGSGPSKIGRGPGEGSFGFRAGRYQNRGCGSIPSVDDPTYR